MSRNAIADHKPAPADMALGATLRRLREARGIALGDMAFVIGVSASEFEAFERGLKPMRAMQLFHSARRLKVSMADLYVAAPV